MELQLFPKPFLEACHICRKGHTRSFNRSRTGGKDGLKGRQPNIS